AGVLGGAASVVLGAVVLLWPRLSLSIFALVVGVWLTFSGLGMLVSAWRQSRVRAEAAGGEAAGGEAAGGEAANGPVQRSALRRHLALVGAAGSLVIALALAAGTVVLHRIDLRDEPDAFYTPPLAVPTEPGRLVRHEPMPADRVPGGLQAWRILYTSTDGEGQGTVVSGTVLAPGVRDGAGLPVVSVAHGTTGVVPRCAPSLADEPFADGAGAALERIVAEGWVGVTSDYVGLGTRGPHPYLVGPDVAFNVLDATRAARELPGLELSNQTVVWGHS